MGYRMYLSMLLLATFTSSFIPDCLAATFTGQCKDRGKVDGELSTTVIWECLPNNTKICVAITEDCSKCDGILTGSSVSWPSSNGKSEDPETQVGRLRRPGLRRRRYRYKREVSGRRSPRIG